MTDTITIRLTHDLEIPIDLVRPDGSIDWDAFGRRLKEESAEHDTIDTFVIYMKASDAEKARRSLP